MIWKSEPPADHARRKHQAIGKPSIEPRDEATERSRPIEMRNLSLMPARLHASTAIEARVMAAG
jgi:hypothetical protein